MSTTPKLSEDQARATAKKNLMNEELAKQKEQERVEGDPSEQPS